MNLKLDDFRVSSSIDAGIFLPKEGVPESES